MNSVLPIIDTSKSDPTIETPSTLSNEEKGNILHEEIDYKNIAGIDHGPIFKLYDSFKTDYLKKNDKTGRCKQRRTLKVGWGKYWKR